MEAGAMDRLVREVDDQRAHVWVILVAVQDDLRRQVHAFYDHVLPLLEAPVYERLHPDRDLRGLRPVAGEDRLLLGHRHPHVLRGYLVGAFVEPGEEVRAYGMPQNLADGIGADHTLYIQAAGDVRCERARSYPGGHPEEDHNR